jgi:hypothetical protein
MRGCGRRISLCGQQISLCRQWICGCGQWISRCGEQNCHCGRRISRRGWQICRSEGSIYNRTPLREGFGDLVMSHGPGFAPASRAPDASPAANPATPARPFTKAPPPTSSIPSPWITARTAALTCATNPSPVRNNAGLRRQRMTERWRSLSSR